MIKCHDVRRSGAAALDLAWIAAGRAAGRLLVEEAGGKVTDFNGKLWTELATYGRRTLATNGRVHKEMQSLLKGK
jgi:myo-inositol-1(or 4)-monophosphatase